MEKYEKARKVLVDSGKSAATAAAVVSTVVAFEGRLPSARWDACTDNELQPLVGDKTVRYRLRLVLPIIFADASARWPCLFGQSRSMLHLTEDAALPVKVFRMPNNCPVRQLFGRLYSEFVRTSSAASPLTVRNNLTFIYHFLFGEPGGLVPVDIREDGDRMVAFLLDQTSEKVADAYKAYRASSSIIQAQTTLATLCTHLRILNFAFKTVLRAHGWHHELTASTFGVAPPKSRRKRLFAEVDNASTASTASTRFSLRFVERPPGPAWIKTVDETRGAQHYFVADEIRKLYLACSSLFEKLMFTALFTTGMRRKGFARAEARSIISRNGAGSYTIGQSWWTSEKRGRRVCYDIGPALSKLLLEWATAGKSGESFVFPGSNNAICVSGSHIFRTFREVAQRAGVAGQHVHPHTTRHTVAWTLSALGNKIEDIASFVHHKSPEVTNAVYVNMNREQRVGRMKCPWLGPAETQTSLEDVAIEMAEAIASPFMSEDGRTFPSFRPVTHKRARRERNLELRKTADSLLKELQDG